MAARPSGLETARVELASENLFMQLSPGADGLLCFPPMTPSVRLHRSVALYCMTVTKAKSLFTFATHLMPRSDWSRSRLGHSGVVAFSGRTAALRQRVLRYR